MNRKQKRQTLLRDGHISKIMDLNKKQIINVCGSLTANRVRNANIVSKPPSKRKTMSEKVVVDPIIPYPADTVWKGCQFPVPIWVYEFEGFSIVSNSQKLTLLKDRTVHDIFRNDWYYTPYVQTGPKCEITRKVLFDRVKDGKFFGYRYVTLNFKGNPLVYYGFLPTDKIIKHVEKCKESYHKRPLVATKPIFPRVIYARIDYEDECIYCPPGCLLVKYTDRESGTVKICCLKKLNLTQVKIEMGQLDSTQCDEKFIQDKRQCIVCASCKECEKLPTFCQTHKVCNHVRRVISSDQDPITQALNRSALVRNQTI